MNYNSTSTDAKNFTLMNGDIKIGAIKYADWFSHKAAISLADGEAYAIVPKDFFESAIELKKGETVVLTMKPGWNLEILINTTFGDTRHFFFKKKNFFDSSYVLCNEQQELLAIHADFKFSKMSYNYTIETTKAFDGLPSSDLILLTALHCANYYISRLTSFILLT